MRMRRLWIRLLRMKVCRSEEWLLKGDMDMNVRLIYCALADLLDEEDPNTEVRLLVV